MDWPIRLKIALGSAKGLAYLHEDCEFLLFIVTHKISNLMKFNFIYKFPLFIVIHVLTGDYFYFQAILRSFIVTSRRPIFFLIINLRQR